MQKVGDILKILRHDDKPLRRVLRTLFLRLPFDIGKLFHIRIRVQDYYIRLHSCAMSVAFWYDPNDRISDYTFITSYLKKGDIYVDVGANIGTVLIPAAKTIKGGKAIGFEPHPRIFSFLKENVLLNDLEMDVELHNCALGNENGYLNFSSQREDDCNRVLLGGKGILVPVRKLDEFFGEYSKINLLKVDVEGYEKFVFDGAPIALAKAECIYFELSAENFNQFGYSVKDFLSGLEKKGFSLFIRKSSDTLESIHVEYRPSEDYMNAFAIRDVDDFLYRTGWRISDGD